MAKKVERALLKLVKTCVDLSQVVFKSKRSSRK